MTYLNGRIAIRALAVLVCFFTVACAAIPTSGGRSDVVASVRAARMRWNTALAERDSATLAGMVEDSAVHVSPQFTHIGRAAYMTVFLGNMAARPGFRLTYQTERVTTCERPGCLVATEYGRWRESWRQDDEPTEVSGTYYAIWRKQGDAWRIRTEAFATAVCRGRRYCGG